MTGKKRYIIDLREMRWRKNTNVLNLIWIGNTHVDSWYVYLKKKKNVFYSFPGGLLVRNSPAKTEDTGSIHSPGRSHMLWGNWAMCHNYWTCAAVSIDRNYWIPLTPEPMIRNRRSHHSEKPTHHNHRRAPAHHNWRKARTATETQHSQKINKNKVIKKSGKYLPTFHYT